MKLFQLFPSNAALRSACGALFLSLCVLSNMAVFANNGPKSAARPVARLITATPRQETPTRGRARVVTATRIAAPSVATAAPSARALTGAAVTMATGDERRAFELINQERRAKGAKPLVWDSELCRLARYHSENMARQGFFNHVGRDGLDPSARAHAFGLGGWQALAENIAYNQGYEDPAAFAVERWMRSDKHRENLLSTGYTHSGLGVAKSADGRVFFTQVFIKR